MSLRVVIARDFDHMSEVAAGLVQDRITKTLRSAKRGGEVLYVLDREAASGVFAARSAIEKRGVTLEDVSGRSAARRVEDLEFRRDTASGLIG